MSTVTVQLDPDTERKLRRQANQSGQTLEAYLEQLTEKAATNGATDQNSEEQPRNTPDPRPSQAEFERLLRDLASGRPLPVFPANFSRADIYEDHD